MKSITFSVITTFCLLMALPLIGQDGKEDGGPTGIFETRQEYYDFMGSVKSEAETNLELRAMIPMINDIVLQNPIGSTAQKYDMQSSTLGLLSNPDVRKDLEMVDSQYEQLKESNEEIQKRVAMQLRGIDLKDVSMLAENIRNVRAMADKELQGNLLPHQLERLRQISTRSQLRRKTLVELLTSDPVKSQLEISDSQSQQLRKAEKEIEADLEKQIAALREKARKRLLANLTVQQQQEVNKMLGDEFRFRSSEGKNEKSKKAVKKQGKSKK